MELERPLKRVFKLLKQTHPIKDESDVAWWGPCFIPRRREWCPSHFVLYGGVLYCRLFIPPGSYGLSWNLESNEVKFEREFSLGDYYNAEPLWTQALTQIERRLKAALKDFARYNRFVEKKLPLASRTGKIKRRLSWPKHAKSPLPLRQMRRLEQVLEEAKGRPLLEKMTLSRYLNTVAIAYDVAFKEFRPLSPLEKYKKKADGRHGGLLDLRPDDSEAFSKWYHSSAWSGTHPWEIVFGHPHGIMISPHSDEGNHQWGYSMWVDSLGWYTTAARMAMALGEHKNPFELYDQKKVLDALKGIDEVDVGPGLYEVHYDDLKKKRPDALGFIRWDPVPPLSPVTPDQVARVSQAERAR